MQEKANSIGGAGVHGRCILIHAATASSGPPRRKLIRKAPRTDEEGGKLEGRSGRPSHRVRAQVRVDTTRKLRVRH